MNFKSRASRCPWSLRPGRLGPAAIALVFLLPVAVFAGGPGPAGADPDFLKVLQPFVTDLGGVASDPQAIALFSSKLGPALGLQDSLSVLTGRGSAGKGASGKDLVGIVTSEVVDGAIRLTAALAAWRLATAIKQAADTGDPAAFQTVLKEASDQLRWLNAQTDWPQLRRAADLGRVLAAFPLPRTPASAQIPPADRSATYAEYAAALDKAYPHLTETDTSWLAIAEREGIDGLHKRLTESPPSSGAQADEQELAARYFHIHLGPVFRARLVADAIRTEANAQQEAQEAWRRLHSWRDRARELKGLARLCGTWQWTIHNHRHHQDHKTVIAFPSPFAQDSSGSRPSKIVVLGDSVYLRWEFQGGFQEDSLLFTGEGQRLEGSFVNSAGAWGSITGKRTGPCQ